MKKLSLVLGLMLLAIGSIIAQQTVTGKVTDQSGEPLLGASILVKGTSTGTVTDIDGNYSIMIPAGANTLVVSYTGFNSQEIAVGNQTVVNITMEEGVTLSEAVVTALGVQRDEKALGYAVQEIGGDQVNLTNDVNFVSSLSGKVAGVQIISSSGASLGGSAKIRIRGVNSLTSGDPLYIVDGTPIANENFSSTDGGADYGNLAADIPSNDIDKISVLKGPAATALYGERAKNGVVMITTKKGSYGKKGLGVTVSSTVTADRVYVLPEYQNEYAGGYSQDFSEVVDPIDGQTYRALNYSADESWGPKMDGTTYRPWWSWYPGTPEYGTTIPLVSNPDNVRDFFDTGITNINSVSIDGGSETTGFRFGFTNLNQSGVIPNSDLDRNSLNVSVRSKLAERLTFGVNANLVFTDGKGRPEFGYSTRGGNPVNSFNQWFQRQLDMTRLADYKNPDGTFRSWNIRSNTDPRPLYWDSPYFSVYENVRTDGRDRYFGDINLNYELADGLNISGALRRDNFTQRIEERVASGGLEEPWYREFVANGTEDNYELIGSYQKSFGRISLDATAGGNIRKNNYHENASATVGGLTAPNLFNTGASVDRPSVTSEVREKTVRSLFGSATVGFNSLAYVGFSLRNDWSSALPANNNNYLYPSVSGSLIFSELINSSWLSFGKLYGSVAQVGADLDPYLTNSVYNFGVAPYGSSSTFTVPNLLPNQTLEQTLSTSWETGIDMRMFNNRLGFNLIYYQGATENDILQVQIPSASGYDQALVNAGRIETKGFELALYGTPIETSNLSWDISVNIARNRSTIEELYGDLTNYKLADGIGGSRWGGFTVNARLGEEWGLANGRGFTYDDQGRTIITPSGGYVVTSNKNLGSILPEYTGGVLNTLNFKGFTLRAMVDFQVGGQFFSTTRMFNAYSGLGIETVGNNALGNPVRDPIVDASGNVIVDADGAPVSNAPLSEVGPASGGVLVEGVSESGEELSVLVDPVSYYGSLFGVHEKWLYDASFVKLREVSIGYTIPKKALGNLPVQSLNFSIIGRNLWLINSNVDGIDPSEILPGANNIVFEERGGLPGVRSIGAKLTVGF
ncbi:MAG: SusC/RagA family TonB-linked outer membrane protein [Lewinellaceae bacterium]|nr:SusC/RagA family TonB-linked outer membrane protein [Phaeodactylibacter sp.]MCB9351011.1 SusC/RagA family TonB-linked outer membrane protein [Lewinellaceae bacterium]